MSYDYVVVGGGSAGSVLASRLSEDPHVTVCLLEAGGAGKSILVKTPMGAVAMLPTRINNWGFKTTEQKGLNGRQGYQPRGKALGGSSAINAMLYIRGTRSDYDHWAKLGNEGWSYDEVLPYFKRSENNSRGNDAFHGTSGPLEVGDILEPNPVAKAFVEAANQVQIPTNPDFNGEDQYGAGLYQTTIHHSREKRGQRCSSAAAFIHPNMDRPNLTVITNAQTTRIIFDGKRAKAVEYKTKRGKLQHAEAKREIILSAGAFGSPQILQLSGIGRPEDIQPYGIQMLHELPGVGQNLQDHIDFIIGYKSKRSDTLGLGIRGLPNMVRQFMKYRKTGTGTVATPFAEGGAFLKTDPTLADPDVQLNFAIAIVDDHARKIHPGYGFSCHCCVLRPYSRGTVTLQSADPMAPPAIDPKFFDDDRDMQTMIRGTKLMRSIMEAPALNAFRHKEIYSEGVETDAEWEEHIRQRADTVYHPVGTCKMGVDDMAVVDPQLRVRGVTNLRIADASIMPTLIGGNTNAPSIMIGEKAADLIRKVTS